MESLQRFELRNYVDDGREIVIDLRFPFLYEYEIEMMRHGEIFTVLRDGEMALSRIYMDSFGMLQEIPLWLPRWNHEQAYETACD